MYILFLTKNTKNDKFFLTITDNDSIHFYGSEKELELIGGDESVWRKSRLLQTDDFKQCVNKYRFLSRKTRKNPLCVTIPNDLKDINPHKVKVKEKRILNKKPKYDPVLYTFYHEEHGEVTCTRYELSQRYNLDYSKTYHLVKGFTKSFKGFALNKEWIEYKNSIKENKRKPKIKKEKIIKPVIKNPLLGRTIPETVKQKMSKAKSGKNHPKYDPNLYTFYHAEHGEVTCTRYELSQNYNLNYNLLLHIVSGNTKMVKGWSLDKDWVEHKKKIQENKNKPKVPFKHSEETKKKISESLSSDSTIHTFYNKQFGYYHCSRYALCQKFNLNKSNVKAIVEGLRGSTKGWTVIKTL